MLKIRHLTKIFKSKHKEKCVALDDINVDLDDDGFVFIVGKSGSGKTTFLNMVAALDSYDKGEIVINGLSLNNLKRNEYDYYRNKNIGFVFQDYQLLDELNVFNNVKVALDFIGDKDLSKVTKALESVGLKGFEKRYPNQLSGGEKQRVAIARAMVKDPAIILADEPTGNLDIATSREILNILKEISKTKLVLIVSHNIFDAHEFASTILELSYGKLIGTYVRNSSNNRSIEVKDGVLRLPLHKDLIDVEKYKVIFDINNGIKEVIQDDKDFISANLIKNNEETLQNLTKNHINFKNAFKLGIAFLKKSLSTIAVYSLIVASLFGVIYSSEIIISTNINESFNETRKEYKKNLITLNDKQDLDFINKINAELNFVDREEVDLLRNNGYTGKIYPSYPLFMTQFYESIVDSGPRALKVVDDDYLYEYVEKIDYQYENKTYKKEGVYITDYTIDMFNLKYPVNRVEYNDYIRVRQLFNFPYLNGVINTHYKEKYPDIYELSKEFFKQNHNAHIFDKCSNKHLDEFIYDLNYYSYAYSFEPDYFDYLMDDYDGGFYGYVNTLFKYKDKNYKPTNFGIYFNNLGVNAIGLAEYTALTGKEPDTSNTGLTKLDEPFTVDIELNNSNLSPNKIKTKTMTFDYIYKDYLFGFSSIMLDKKDKDLREEFLPYRDLTLENNNELKTIFNKGLFKNLIISNLSSPIRHVHDRLTSIFKKIFTLVIILLILASFISLIFYSAYIVKKNVRNIGVLKSLGGRSKDILVSLSLNIILTSILTSLLSVGFSYLFLLIIEKILLSSYKSSSLEFINNYGFKYLLNNELIIGLNVFFIVGLLILSSLLIFIRLNKYKPTELIKGAK